KGPTVPLMEVMPTPSTRYKISFWPAEMRDARAPFTSGRVTFRDMIFRGPTGRLLWHPPKRDKPRTRARATQENRCRVISIPFLKLNFIIRPEGPAVISIVLSRRRVRFQGQDAVIRSRESQERALVQPHPQGGFHPEKKATA